MWTDAHCGRGEYYSFVQTGRRPHRLSPTEIGHRTCGLGRVQVGPDQSRKDPIQRLPQPLSLSDRTCHLPTETPTRTITASPPMSRGGDPPGTRRADPDFPVPTAVSETGDPRVPHLGTRVHTLTLPRSPTTSVLEVSSPDPPTRVSLHPRPVSGSTGPETTPLPDYVHTSVYTHGGRRPTVLPTSPVGPETGPRTRRAGTRLSTTTETREGRFSTHDPFRPPGNPRDRS